MGNTYTVKIWTNAGSNRYRYDLHWEGQSLVRAIREMWYAKRKGVGCIVLEWRPT